MTDNDKLNEILSESKAYDADREIKRANSNNYGATPSQSLSSATNEMMNNADIRQWAVGGNETYRPISKAIPHLEPAVYSINLDNSGLYIQKVKVITDDLFILPDSINEKLIKSMEKFWNSKDKYVQRGLLYKRGIFLWGPQGSGKTAQLQLLMKQLIDKGGIVVNVSNPELAVMGLAAIRRIEPDRNIIALLEDADEIVEKHGEHELLALLDGENQIGNIVFIATSNYPDRLGARILNRPSRFDERFLVDMPSAAARNGYLTNTAPFLEETDLVKWVKDTEGMSIAHLRELVAAVVCLEQDYTDVIDRLKSMKIRPREKDGYGSSAGVGFTPKQSASTYSRIW